MALRNHKARPEPKVWRASSGICDVVPGPADRGESPTEVIIVIDAVNAKPETIAYERT